MLEIVGVAFLVAPGAVARKLISALRTVIGRRRGSETTDDQAREDAPVRQDMLDNADTAPVTIVNRSAVFHSEIREGSAPAAIAADHASRRVGTGDHRGFVERASASASPSSRRASVIVWACLPISFPGSRSGLRPSPHLWTCFVSDWACATAGGTGLPSRLPEGGEARSEGTYRPVRGLYRSLGRGEARSRSERRSSGQNRRLEYQ